MDLMERTVRDEDTHPEEASGSSRASVRGPVLSFALFTACGVVLALFVALDWTRFANQMGFAVALFAHCCLAVLGVLVVTSITDARSGKGKGPIVLWAGLFAVGALGLAALDSYVWHLPIAAVWRRVYLVAMLVVVVGTVLVHYLVLSPHHLTNHRKLERFLHSALIGAPGIALGVLLVVAPVYRFDRNRQRELPQEVPRIPAITQPVGTYVALGDSYSAGEGVRPFLPSPRPACHRSARGYPRLLHFSHSDTVVDFRACSSAVTADVDLGIVGGDLPQVDPVPRPDVGLVTLTIGGNDVIFSRIVRACVLYEDCMARTFTPPHPSLARPSVRYPGPAPFDEWAPRAITLAERNVSRVYGTLRARYPNARIVVVGYPQLFPAGPAPWRDVDCAIVLRRVDASEREGLRDLTDRLNGTLYRLAHGAGIEFVSPASGWVGHEPCGSDGQYTNAIKLDVAHIVDGGTFHPNLRGQQQLARTVACYLHDYPDGPAPFGDDAPGSPGRPLRCA